MSATPFANELDAFKDSDLLLRVMEGFSSQPLQRQFMRNRFAAVFEAGWNARAKYDTATQHPDFKASAGE